MMHAQLREDQTRYDEPDTNPNPEGDPVLKGEAVHCREVPTSRDLNPLRGDLSGASRDPKGPHGEAPRRAVDDPLTARSTQPSLPGIDLDAGRARIKIMSRALICRLHGHRTVIRHVPTGFGPFVWTGGFVTDDGEPYVTRHANGDPVCEVRAAPTLAKLLAKLLELAPNAVHQPVSRSALLKREARLAAKAKLAQDKARYREAQGHPKGTPAQPHRGTPP